MPIFKGKVLRFLAVGLRLTPIRLEWVSPYQQNIHNSSCPTRLGSLPFRFMFHASCLPGMNLLSAGFPRHFRSPRAFLSSFLAADKHNTEAVATLSSPGAHTHTLLSMPYIHLSRCGTLCSILNGPTALRCALNWVCCKMRLTVL